MEWFPCLFVLFEHQNCKVVQMGFVGGSSQCDLSSLTFWKTFRKVTHPTTIPSQTRLTMKFLSDEL